MRSVVLAPMRRQVERGRREHDAADLVEPAGEHVEAVHEPVRRRAVDGLRDAEPAVDRTAAGSREVAREAADRLGRHAGDRGDALGRHLRDRRRHRLDPVDEVGRASRTGEPLGGDHLQHRGEQPHVGARDHGHVLVGDVGRLGAARVDHHHAPAAGAQRREPALHVRRGHDRAVAHHGVAADHEQMVGAVEVGHREHQRRPEQQVGEQVLRLLVDARRAVAPSRAERVDEHRDERHRCPAVGDRVAEVERDRVAAVAVADRGEPVGDEVERLVPADLLPRAVRGTAYRAAEPVGVGLQVLQRDPLGADVAARERVELVATDRQDPRSLDLDGQPAAGLAQVARAVHGATGPHARRLGRTRGTRTFLTNHAPHVKYADGPHPGWVRAVAGITR